MTQLTIGIDLGSSAVKVVRLEKARGGFDVVDTDAVPLLPGTGAELRERQQTALRELKARGALDGERFVTGLPGDTTATRTLFFPYSDKRKIEQTLPFELEAEIPFDIDDIVISWQINGTRKTESGATETEVLVAYARREAMESLLAMLAEVDIDPRHVRFVPFVLDSVYQHVYQDNHGGDLVATDAIQTPGGTVIQLGEDAGTPAIAIVDIGKRSTQIALITEERVVGGHTILHGGEDATRALSRALNLSLEEAERGKQKEGFIEVVGAKATYEQQTQISEILKRAYAPVGRRLRQIFQSTLSDHKARVVKVILVGGGSRVNNLDRHLAEILNVRVVRGTEINSALGAALPMDSGDGLQVATALGFALSGLPGHQERMDIDFRSGDFSWRGELDFLRDRAVAIGAWVMVIFLLVAVTGLVRGIILSGQESDLRDDIATSCEKITGKSFSSITTCKAIIAETINGDVDSGGIPTWSAVDTYLELSKRMPQNEVLPRKVSEMDINAERIRMKASTSDFDAVDKIVEALKTGACFSSVEKGKARNAKEGVEFDVVVRLDCDKAKGGADPDWIKGVPRGSITAKMKKLRPRKTTAKPGIKSPLPNLRPRAETPVAPDRDAAREARRQAIKAARERAKDAKARVAARKKQRGATREVARKRAKERAEKLRKMTPEERVEYLREQGLLNNVRGRKPAADDEEQ